MGGQGINPSSIQSSLSSLFSQMGQGQSGGMQQQSGGYGSLPQGYGTAPPSTPPPMMPQMMALQPQAPPAAQTQQQNNMPSSQFLQGQNLFNNLYQQSGNNMGQQQFGLGMNFENPNGFAMMGKMTGNPAQNQQNYQDMAMYYNQTYPSQSK
jgi:hypothetical protein